MVLTARGSTLVVVAAVLHTLVSPFLADEVGQSEGILGDVGLQAIAAQAAVREGVLGQSATASTGCSSSKDIIGVAYRIACVSVGGAGRDQLADERASAQFALAPRLYSHVSSVTSDIVGLARQELLLVESGTLSGSI